MKTISALLFALLFSLLISACGVFGTANKPETIYVPKEVMVPVPVKCNKPQITKPDKVFDTATKSDLLYTNLAKLGAENQNLSAYTLELESALDACSK